MIELHFVLKQNPNPDRRIPSARVAPGCMAIEMNKTVAGAQAGSKVRIKQALENGIPP
jgi:hypothetical protein